MKLFLGMAGRQLIFSLKYLVTRGCSATGLPFTLMMLDNALLAALRVLKLKPLLIIQLRFNDVFYSRGQVVNTPLNTKVIPLLQVVLVLF